ncbi:universal stress protein [Thalassospira lucentensis]|uniref:universal stress protein n=1 Tax=Thalassospira lucentensis TaxID=168935 RepID=UPI0029439487|nr:universal stress protein [Thalassospira lucentensis]WOI12793.1 universal stress protein [Thalassospira lucentensis]
MYRKIMVPVDLTHIDKLEKALSTAADLAKHYDAKICFFGVGTNTPSPIAHTPAEYDRKMAAFAEEQAKKTGIECSGMTRISHDPAIDLSEIIVDAATEVKADVIVMASHVPGMADHIFASHGGYVASHWDHSVFLVR